MDIYILHSVRLTPKVADAILVELNYWLITYNVISDMILCTMYIYSSYVIVIIVMASM